MKKIIAILLSFALMAFATLVFAKPSSAISPTWDLTGAYVIDFACETGCSGTYTHTMDVTGMDLTTGDFSGSGYYNLNPAYTWDLTGNVLGSDFLFNILYTGLNPGYTVEGNGAISNTGTLSGTATSSSGQTFTFVSSNGNATPFDFDWGSKVNASKCADKKGSPVINVAQKVTGDVDSGLNGYWAFDEYNRTIQVWRTSVEHTYCAVVRYNGQFDAVLDQQSPGFLNEILTGNEKGTMHGGRTAEIIGTFNPTDWATKGTIGSIDYGCKITGSCSSPVSWPIKYFPTGYTYTDVWWGWIYQGGQYGTWINSIEGNWGDITP